MAASSASAGYGRAGRVNGMGLLLMDGYSASSSCINVYFAPGAVSAANQTVQLLYRRGVQRHPQMSELLVEAGDVLRSHDQRRRPEALLDQFPCRRPLHQ